MSNKKLTDNFGTARWAEEEDLEAESIHVHALLPFPNTSSNIAVESFRGDKRTKGFVFSKLADPKVGLGNIRKYHVSGMDMMLDSFSNLFRKSKGDEYLTWDGDGHVLTVAPTRSGKGVGLVIPNLLRYPGSAIVVDPKGENYAITSEHRRRYLTKKIIRLDPFGCMGGADTTDYINPLEGLADYSTPERILDSSPEILDELSTMADAMIMRPADEKDPHWNDKARTLIKTLMMAVICGLGGDVAPQINLPSVRKLLTSGNVQNYLEWLRSPSASGYEKRKAYLGGMLVAGANECCSMATQEFSSVLSSALRHTEFLDSPLMQRAFGDGNCRGKSYNIRDLKEKGDVTIYMIIPPQHLERYSRAIRVWTTAAINAMTATTNKPKGGNVLFMMDEMAQLGTLEKMRQVVRLLAGYGMSLWMIWQDLSQLKRLYKEDWESFLANAKVQQFFGINDQDTAKHVSEMLGKATVEVDTFALTHSSSSKVTDILATKTDGDTQTFAEKERDLLSADEVRRLNREWMLMFVQGCPPIIAKRITYFSDANFKEYARENPYITGVNPFKGNLNIQ